MIKKERDANEHLESGRMAGAGKKAEEQMAFYLKRAYQDHKHIWVFNDLRFRDEDDDCAQIDHLILHRHGFIIVESKSVTTQIRVNEYEEWSRKWNGWQGMPSPVQQAKRQGIFLKKALSAYCDELLGKVFGLMQLRFNNCPIEIIIAISDSGTIERKTTVPELVKADQVPDKILKIFDRHRKAASLLRAPSKADFTSNDGIYNFKNEEMERICEWLLAHHYPATENDAPAPDIETPAAPVLPEPPPHPPPKVSDLSTCDKCSGARTILWGRYSYYWKCPNCDTNTAIKLFCEHCKEKMKLRKSGKLFYQCCEPCATESLYHTTD